MPAVTTTLKALNRGEDRKSPGHLIPEGFVSRARNVRMPAGVPQKINGYARFFSTADGRPPDGGTVLYFTQHIIGAANIILVVSSTGRAYQYDDTTGVFTLRRILPTATAFGALGTATWWEVTFGSTKIIGDGANLPWRLGALGRLTPLAAAFVLGFEAAETWTLGGGTVTDNGADTTNFVEGAQGHRYTWDAGVTQTIFNNTNGPFDIQTSPYGVAPNFGTADPGLAAVRLRVWVTSGAANYTSGFIRFGNNAGTATRTFTFPGTLQAGENLLVLLASAAVDVGVPALTAIERITISLTTGGGGTLDVTFDDLLIEYLNAGPTGADVGEAHKSILFQSGVTATPFRLFFSNPNNPSYFTPTDTLDVFDKTRSDPEVEVLGLRSFFDTLITGTRNTIFGVSGDDRDTFVLSEQSAGQGVTHHRSFAPFGDTFLFHFKGRIYAYSVSQLQAISLPEEPLLEAMDSTHHMVALRWLKWNEHWFTYRQAGGVNAVLRYGYASGARDWSYLDIPAVALFPYQSTTGEVLIVSLHTDGLLYVQDQGGQFDGADFDAVIETRWMGIESAKVISKWWRTHFTAEMNPGSTIEFAWRVANDPAAFETAAWSTEVSLDATSLDEGAFADIGERGRYCQLRFTSTTSTGLLVWVWPWSGNVKMKIPVGDPPDFTAQVLRGFRLMPPIEVERFPLHARG